MEVKIKKLHEAAILPRKATSGSAAYDLFCPYDCELREGRQVIPLGIALEIPQGYEAKIEARSGYSSKGFAATLGQTEYRLDADVITGKIDSDYRGEIGVIIHSREQYIHRIKAGQRIAQLTFYAVESPTLTEVSELSDTNRGGGGFGHSGV